MGSHASPNCLTFGLGVSFSHKQTCGRQAYKQHSCSTWRWCGDVEIATMQCRQMYMNLWFASSKFMGSQFPNRVKELVSHMYM